jgi:hypothetical protein
MSYYDATLTAIFLKSYGLQDFRRNFTNKNERMLFKNSKDVLSGSPTALSCGFVLYSSYIPMILK